MTEPIGPSYRENKRLGGTPQYTSDNLVSFSEQAERQTALLQQIRNGVSFIAVVAVLVGILILINLIAAAGS